MLGDARYLVPVTKHAYTKATNRYLEKIEEDDEVSRSIFAIRLSYYWNLALTLA